MKTTKMSLHTRILNIFWKYNLFLDFHITAGVLCFYAVTTFFCWILYTYLLGWCVYIFVNIFIKMSRKLEDEILTLKKKK